MTLPAQKIEMPQMRAPHAGEKHTRLTKPETNILMTTGVPYTRVLVALISTKWLTRFESRYLSIADLMTMCDLSPASVYAAIKTLTSEGRCHKLEGRYGYVEVTGPRLSIPRPLSSRGRYDREGGKGARKPKPKKQQKAPAEFHNFVHNPVHNYGRTYGDFGAIKAVWDGEKGVPNKLRINVYLTTTTLSGDFARKNWGGFSHHWKASAVAPVVVVVGSAAQDSEQHPPVGGAADAAKTDSAAPVQDFHDQDPEMQEKPATSTENVPPAAAPLAPRTRPELAAASAAHPVPASLNRLLWPDWVTAFAAIEGAGLSGTWTRWQAHVGGNASQQLAQAERWADWVGAGLADALRLQVPETIADTSVRSPARHLAGAMTNRAEEARRAPAPAPTSQAAAHDGPVVAPVTGQRRVDPRTGEIWTVESIAYGQVTFEEVAAPSALRVATVATWEVAL